ncbi:MAG: oxidoreductase [Spirochaetaceae bacterium]|jgi:nitrogenase molybdenum-iron protein alpha/beta subunit|nr:oxidoreductase [Spirochaetaceae bacterium]
MIHYSENITPDSFSGALFAVEGIKDACTILNGPTGCKFYHSAIADSQFLRTPTFNPLEYTEGFYFGQSRIPSTYLDGEDYVFGSGEKIAKILRAAVRKNPGLVAIINSPGAALIGDDLDRFLAEEVGDIPAFALENTGFSGSFGSGYQKAIIRALDALRRRAPPLPAGADTVAGPGAARSGGRPKTVNILGLCIYQKHYAQNLSVLKRLLEISGVGLNAAPGAGDSAASLSGIGKADLNVALYPEYSLEIAEKLKAEYGTPYIVPEEGPPIGFDAAESFIRGICRELGGDRHPALEEIERARARAYLYLSRFSSLLGLPRGTLFSVKAEASVAYAVTKWLCAYLGMIPASVSVLPGGDASFIQKLGTFLAGIRCGKALEAPIIETPAHILLADGNTIAELKLYGQRFCGIEIALPSLGYIDIAGKTFFGGDGALFLLEQILNGLRYVMV